MTPLLAFDAAALRRETFDFLIIGSGVAGLSCALELAPHGRVAVLTTEKIGAGSTKWAQGGSGAAVAPAPLAWAGAGSHESKRRRRFDRVGAGRHRGGFSPRTAGFG